MPPPTNLFNLKNVAIMKRLKKLLMLALVGLMAACSCNELPSDLPQPFAHESIGLDVETRAETYQGQSLDQDYFVTAEDLENYVKFRRNSSKRSNLTVKEVKSYGFDADQTLFYILNFDQGWEVVAADKRVQPSLAHGGSGEFTMDCDNEPMKFWMNMLANGVLQTRLGNTERGRDTSATAEKNSSGEQEDTDHTSFWNTISPQNNTTRGDGNINTPTPGPLDTLGIDIILPPQEVHRYFIPNAVVTDSHISTIGTQIPTQWGQGWPWNEYCPLKSDSNNNSKVPAGCVPVALSQFLYYMATNVGWVLQAPTQAFCSGAIPFHTQSFGNLSTTAWSAMALNNRDNYLKCDNTAKLIGYVGFISDTNYGNDGSGTSLNDLIDALSDYFNISCTKSSYDSSAVISELVSNPVIATGYRDVLSVHGHAWIIDAYRVITTQTTRYFIETTEELTLFDLEQLTINDATGYIQENGISKHFHMNWGWGGSSDGYFGLATEDWDTPQYDPYQYYAKILHNFNINQ